MNFISKLMGGRKTLADADSRIGAASDELSSLTKSEVMRISNPVVVKNHISQTVQFDTFAEICVYRYAPPNSLMRLCKNEEHEAHASGIAACRSELCPKLREAMKNK